MSLGTRLRHCRKQKKLTQKELANTLGIDHTTVSKWESDTYEPDGSTLNDIADLFDVSIDYLLGRTDNPNPQWAIDLASGGAVQVPENLMNDEIDPEIHVFFKDFQSAPKEKQEEMIRFWKFIQQQERGRKPGDKQGE